MKVKIECEFEVTSKEEGLTEHEAKQAAELAFFNNGSLTNDNIRVSRLVRQHVDGFGNCEVSIPELTLEDA